MKAPTLRKLRHRGLVAIRYHAPPPHSEFRHGWIIERGARGALKVQLVGEERPRRLSVEEARFVRELQ